MRARRDVNKSEPQRSNQPPPENFQQLNREPVNQQALQLLHKLNQPVQPDLLHAYQLMLWGQDYKEVLDQVQSDNWVQLKNFLGLVVGWPPDKQMNLLLRGTPQNNNPDEQKSALAELPSSPDEAAALLLSELESSAQETIPNW